ncbi:MAG: dihydroorotase, partial [Cyanobacteria bacterium P01_F01_bin.42]
MTLQLVRQARLIDPVQGLDQVGDVLVRDGQIEAVAEQLSPPSDTVCEVIDAAGMILGPGLVDLYSTSGEPGNESRETLSELVEAAAAGGFTRVNLLPNTEPCMDHPGVVQQVRSQSGQGVQINVWGALTQGAEGEQLSQLHDLSQQGILGLSDGQPLQDWLLIQRLLDYAKPMALTVALWPCLPALAGESAIREGVNALQFGLPSASAAAETSAIAGIIELI